MCSISTQVRYLEMNLIVLGIRCSNKDFAYAVMSGNKAAPTLAASAINVYPKGYTAPEILKWLLQEIQNLNKQHAVTNWAIKGAEPMAAKGKPYAFRVECEAMTSLSAANCGRSSVVRKVKTTIAKDLGLPGKAKSLTDNLDQSLVPGLADMSDKEFEAVVVAWSELP